ncbi:3-ketoacyl-ACP reductase [Flexithrix dorotheae]|uniref:3-ketoacyl-ACP reductase n=1 Tax=Flexithrix dorotheae TaxID=70993 RepID=UPI000368F494|nr:3-ketoacyl-ACP reductase [Flexithrix dorotheae]
MKKSALVTGGSRGIGLGVALQLADAGYDLAINGMRPENDVADVLETLRSKNVKVIYCQGNIGDAADRNGMIQKIKEEFGQLNVLVNNAGVAPNERKDLLETSEESFDRVLGINLKGSFFLTQLAANWMVEQKTANPDFKASIINVSSISATTASINRGEYCVSKAGLSMVTQLFAVRLGDLDIPVYEVRPGIITTDMTSGVKEKYDKLFAEGIAVQKRWGTTEDVGKAVRALATGDFPYSTGQVIMVDGGFSIDRL